MKSTVQAPASRDKFGALFALVIGLLFVVGGFWLRNNDVRERATLRETQGTVVDAVSRRERENGNDKLTYAPIIEFMANGDRTRFTGSFDTSRLSNGNIVVVRYHPANAAASARVVDAFEGLVPWSMIGIGGCAMLAGLGGLLNLRRLFRA